MFRNPTRRFFVERHVDPMFEEAVALGLVTKTQADEFSKTFCEWLTKAAQRNALYGQTAQWDSLIGAYLDATTMRAASAAVRAADLLAALHRWCVSNEKITPEHRHLWRALHRRGFRQKRGSPQYVGLAFKPGWSPQESAP